MRLQSKLLLLAALPLLLSLALIATGVRHQERSLAERERALVEHAYMAAREAELRHYVDLARSILTPLYDEGEDTPARRDEALRLLASLDYGDDGYFFVYDLNGRSLMHPRQPELVGTDLWDLRDDQGVPTIQHLVAKARAGGGFIKYQWRKPSTGQRVQKMGYVIALPKWGWMIGTGLYLDDIEQTLRTLDQQVSRHIETTLLWIAGIAAVGVALISASGLWLNISEHKVADAKLRLMARQVVRSQEDERAHLARELHDGTSQTLVSTKLLIESVVDAMERSHSAVPAALGTALARINDSLVEVRRLSHRLRPAMLDTLGLPAALEQLGREVSEAGGAQVIVQALPLDDGERLPAEVATVLFRVTQEALTNIGKHAGARQVRITLQQDAEGLRLSVADDGRGFDLQAVQLDPRRGIGLRNMRERLEAIGGSLHLHSSPGGGTIVEAVLPADALQRLREP
ncbi:MAG: cache domain-containing protein [Rhizobacter sp.]